MEIRAAIVAFAVAAGAATAHADDNDLILSRLASCVDATGAAVPDCGATAVDVVGDNTRFRTLASELGVVLAPRLIEPADTLGFGGFQFSADIAFTTIDGGGNQWRARELDGGDDVLQTIGLHVRKGIWLPAPSFEVGLGIIHLLESEMWAAQGYAKLALHEGYHDLPIPSVAIRGAASRLTGSELLDMTVASLDITLSKAFGVAGSFNAAPYVGWNWLFIVPRSEVIDKTPQIDPANMMLDTNLSFVFADQDDIIRNRVFGGLKLQYYVFVLSLEANLALAGSSTDDRAGTDTRCVSGSEPTEACDAEDQSKLQSTYTVSVGLDF